MTERGEEVKVCTVLVYCMKYKSGYYSHYIAWLRSFVRRLFVMWVLAWHWVLGIVVS